MTALKIADAGGSISHAPRPRRHTDMWLFYVWAPGRSIAEPINGDEQAARRMLQWLIDYYHLPPGKWYRGPKAAL